MKYIGEHLLPGGLGQFFLVLSLVSSLVATIAFAVANKKVDFAEKQSWIRIARFSFLLETISVFSTFIILYYIISNHLFEYKYAWQHSDKSLQIEYLFSCFWEGQEGSFMLWSFWHCVLGWILIWKSKQFEAGVMTVISFAQFCLATMIIGVYFFGERVGSSPFVLLRNEGILDDAPMFHNAAGELVENYLSFIKDGNGLNTLLQNYWMVIHPPVLFLGFASTIVPFAFAYTGLVNKDHSWIKVSIPWAVFSVAILGTGIMMGAMWAYESLSFGGYWAWDPVENASLVPWLIMVAGLHVNLIYKSTGYSLRSIYFFYAASFILILYSTFLTRSGVLGDTSVHAFTALGMNVQLYLFLNIFVWFPTLFAARKLNTKFSIIAAFIVLNILSIYFPVLTLVSIMGSFVWLSILLNKNVPTITKEESTYSREFWMFIGSLVLFLSGLVITMITSLPVFNKIFEGWSIFGKKAFSQPEDAEFTHNQIQIFVAVILGLLTAVTQYFKYKDTPKGFFSKKIWKPTLIALVISLLISFFGDIDYRKHGIGFLGAIHLAIFSAVYTIVANASYVWLGLKGKIKASGASVAHIGFGMILLGILISSGNKKILSWNKTGIAVFEKTKQEDPAENTTLFKGIATDMGKYMVTYISDSINPRDRKKYFEIDFKPKDGSKGFKVYPDVIENKKEKNLSANPDAKHYWSKDIFVYITAFKEDDKKDTASFKPQPIKKGDTAYYSNGFMVFDSVLVNPREKNGKFTDDERAVFLSISVTSKEGRRFKAMPGIAIKDSSIRDIPDTVVAQNLVLKFNKVLDQNIGKLEIGIKESKSLTTLLTLKVLEFPMIRFLWFGVVVMVIGCFMSIVQRLKQGKKGLKAV